MPNYVEKKIKWLHFGTNNEDTYYFAYIAKDENYTLCIVDNLDLNYVIIRLEDNRYICDNFSIDKMRIRLNYDYEYLVEIFKSDWLELITLSIDKEAISITNKDKEINDLLSLDIKNEPHKSKAFISKLCYLLYVRFIKTSVPLAILSFTGSIKEQQKIKEGLVFVAQKWSDYGYIDEEYIEYLNCYLDFHYQYTDKFITKNRIELLSLINAKIEDKNSFLLKKKQKLFSSNVFLIKIKNLFITESGLTKAYFQKNKFINFSNYDNICSFWYVYENLVYKPLLLTASILTKLFNYESVKEITIEFDWFLMYLAFECIAVNKDTILNNKNYIYYFINSMKSDLFDYSYEINLNSILKEILVFSDTINKYYVDEREKDLNVIPFVLALAFRLLHNVDDYQNKVSINWDFESLKMKKILIDNGIDYLFCSEPKLDFCLIINDKIKHYYEKISYKKNSILRTLYWFKDDKEKWM